MMKLECRLSGEAAAAAAAARDKARRKRLGPSTWQRGTYMAAEAAPGTPAGCPVLLMLASPLPFRCCTQPCPWQLVVNYSA